MRSSVLAFAIFAAACQQEPAQKPLDDPQAIAAVTEAQRLEAILPQQLLPSDFAQMEDQGASCAFYQQERALAVARPNFGWIKLEGRLLRLTAKGGNGPLGTRSHYTGGALTLEIIPTGAAETASQSRQTMPAAISITDKLGREVFGVGGYMRCAAQ